MGSRYVEDAKSRRSIVIVTTKEKQERDLLRNGDIFLRDKPQEWDGRSRCGNVCSFYDTGSYRSQKRGGKPMSESQVIFYSCAGTIAGMTLYQIAHAIGEYLALRKMRKAQK